MVCCVDSDVFFFVYVVFVLCCCCLFLVSLSRCLFGWTPVFFVLIGNFICLFLLGFGCCYAGIITILHEWFVCCFCFSHFFCFMDYVFPA